MAIFLQLTALFSTLDSLFIMLLSNWFEKIMWTKYKFTVHNMCVCIKGRTAPLAICPTDLQACGCRDEKRNFQP